MSYRKIIEIAKTEYDYSYPDTHIWHRKLLAAIAGCYECYGAMGSPIDIYTLVNIIVDLDARLQAALENK